MSKEKIVKLLTEDECRARLPDAFLSFVYEGSFYVVGPSRVLRFRWAGVGLEHRRHKEDRYEETVVDHMYNPEPYVWDFGDPILREGFFLAWAELRKRSALAAVRTPGAGRCTTCDRQIARLEDFPQGKIDLELVTNLDHVLCHKVLLALGPHAVRAAGECQGQAVDWRRRALDAELALAPRDPSTAGRR